MSEGFKFRVTVSDDDGIVMEDFWLAIPANTQVRAAALVRNKLELSYFAADTKDELENN